MNVRLKIVRNLLQEAINNIDAGNSNHSSEELDSVIETISKLNKGVKRISKAQACDNILHCSHSTFNNYLSLGIIPQGRKEKGFKELFWAEHDFDKALEYNHKHKLFE